MSLALLLNKHAISQRAERNAMMYCETKREEDCRQNESVEIGAIHVAAAVMTIQ